MRIDMVDEFVARFGEDEWQRLYEAVVFRQTADRISVVDELQHDAINWTFHGYYESVAGEEFEFRLDDGNISGTHFIYGHDIGFRPPSQCVKRLVPQQQPAPAGQQVYEYWRTCEWFKLLESKINYDLFFDPCEKTRRHWESEASKRGLRIETVAEEGGAA